MGILSLVFGLILGLLLSQGLSIFSLRLFAIDMSKFQIVFTSLDFRYAAMSVSLATSISATTFKS